MEQGSLKYHREVQRPWEENHILDWDNFTRYIFLGDRKTGNTYSFGEYYWNFTTVLLKNLRDNFVDVNFIGIRLLNSGSDAGSFIRHFTFGEEKKRELALQRWKKDKTFTLDETGYHTYFGMSTFLSNDASKLMKVLLSLKLKCLC